MYEIYFLMHTLFNTTNITKSYRIRLRILFFFPLEKEFRERFVFFF